MLSDPLWWAVRSTTVDRVRRPMPGGRYHKNPVRPTTTSTPTAAAAPSCSHERWLAICAGTDQIRAECRTSNWITTASRGFFSLNVAQLCGCPGMAFHRPGYCSDSADGGGSWFW